MRPAGSTPSPGCSSPIPSGSSRRLIEAPNVAMARSADPADGAQTRWPSWRRVLPRIPGRTTTRSVGAVIGGSSGGGPGSGRVGGGGEGGDELQDAVVVLADLGELVDPRRHLAGSSVAGLPDQVAGLVLVAADRGADGAGRTGRSPPRRGWWRRCRPPARRGRGLAGSGRMARACSRPGNSAWFGQGLEDRLGVAGPGQVSSAAARWPRQACWSSSCAASSSRCAATVSVSRSSRRSASRAR